MADVHTKAARSFNMSQIKGKDTKPELLVRKFLHSHGMRYRLHAKQLPGTPDIVLAKYNTVVFVDGCFWHAHEGCKKFIIPKSRTDYWQKRIGRNVANDHIYRTHLAARGWRVLTVWECDLRPDKRSATLERLAEDIAGPPESEVFI